MEKLCKNCKYWKRYDSTTIENMKIYIGDAASNSSYVHGFDIDNELKLLYTSGECTHIRFPFVFKRVQENFGCSLWEENNY